MLIPWAAARARLAAKDLAASQDVVQRLADAGFLDSARRMDGLRSFGLNEAQFRRLERTLTVRKHLTGRPMFSKVAWCLAAENELAPPDLVRSDLVRRLRIFYSFSKRALAKTLDLPRNPNDATGNDINHAALTIGARYARGKKRTPRLTLNQQRVQVAARVALGFLYDQDVKQSTIMLIPEMLRDSVMMDTKKRGHLGTGVVPFTLMVVQVAEMLKGTARWLRLDEDKNALFQAAKNMPDDELLELVGRCTTLADGFEAGMYLILRVCGAGTTYLDSLHRQFGEFLPAVVVAGLADSRASESAQRIREELGCGKTDYVTSLLKDTADTVTLVRKAQDLRNARS